MENRLKNICATHVYRSFKNAKRNICLAERTPRFYILLEPFRHSPVHICSWYRCAHHTRVESNDRWPSAQKIRVSAIEFFPWCRDNLGVLERTNPKIPKWAELLGWIRNFPDAAQSCIGTTFHVYQNWIIRCTLGRLSRRKLRSK